MARIYRRADGSHGFRLNAAEEAQFPLPGDVADQVAFDEDTNVVLAGDIRLNFSTYSIVAGVLKKNGVTVNPAADGDRASLKNAAAAVVAANQTYLGIASPTNPQVVAQLRAITQQTNQLIKRLVQLSQ